MNTHIYMGVYDVRLVVLSIAISIAASYVALDLSARTAASAGLQRRAWVTGGAVAMGSGVWAMHYIGMVAFHLPVPIRYNVPTVLLSWLAAIFAAAVTMLVVARPQLRIPGLLVGCLAMGAGICSMHYIGMSAMRLTAVLHYNPVIVALSAAIAVLVSCAALWLAFKTRCETGSLLLKAAGAILMGLAISSMHYTGMAAVHFQHHLSDQQNDLTPPVGVSSLGIAGIAGTTLAIFCLALVSALADRRIRARQALLESAEKRFGVLFDSSLVGVCRTTFDGHFIDVNEIFVRMLGFESRDEVLRSSATTYYMSGDDRLESLSMLQAKGSIDGQEVCLKKKDGSPLWVLVNESLIKGVSAARPEILAIIMDITGLKNSSAELLIAKQKAEAADIAKTQFVMNMSHEMRTPMNAVLGMTDLLLSIDDDSEHREYLNTIRSSAHSLLSMIETILDFANMQGGNLILTSEPFDLARLLEDVAAWFRTSLEEHGLQLEICVHPETPRQMIGDASRIRQIFSNLISNAIKFTPAGKIIVQIDEVSLEPGGYLIQSSVRDTGVGIKEDHMKAIFEAFSQADNSSTRKYGGTGLGLTIASSLIRAMGGRIWAQSSPGRGSAFCFTMRLRQGEIQHAGLELVAHSIPLL